MLELCLRRQTRTRTHTRKSNRESKGKKPLNGASVINLHSFIIEKHTLGGKKEENTTLDNLITTNRFIYKPINHTPYRTSKVEEGTKSKAWGGGLVIEFWIVMLAHASYSLTYVKSELFYSTTTQELIKISGCQRMR